MANELQSLSQLFQNRLFRIPDYQRGYAWQQQQLVDFWDDLVNLHPDRYHYTGLLSLKPLKNEETLSWGEDLWLIENGYKPCHIVDGQQRITTFCYPCMKSWAGARLDEKWAWKKRRKLLILLTAEILPSAKLFLLLIFKNYLAKVFI